MALPTSSQRLCIVSDSLWAPSYTPRELMAVLFRDKCMWFGGCSTVQLLQQEALDKPWVGARQCAHGHTVANEYICLHVMAICFLATLS